MHIVSNANFQVIHKMDLAWYTIFHPTSFELVYPVGTNVYIAILGYNVVLKHPQWLMFWNSSPQ